MISVDCSLSYPVWVRKYLWTRSRVKVCVVVHDFSMNLSETFRINVNMDFAHTNRGRFLIKANWGFEIWPFK